MFLETQRMTGRGSNIKIIEPSHYLEFFQDLYSNSKIDAQFKAFLAVAVSGGCRVSEALSLKVGHIASEGKFKVKVLKKRTLKPILRSCLLSPIAHQIVREYIESKQLNTFSDLFTMHRSTVHRHVKRTFGDNACAHSIARHSHISWLLHSLEIPTAKVAVEMAMLTHVVDSYNHANIEVEQANRFRIA